MRPGRWAWLFLAAAPFLIAFAFFFSGGSAPDPPAPAPPDPFAEAQAHYADAIGDLETVLSNSDAPEAMREAREAIAPQIEALDVVIAESRQRAEETPDDEVAQETFLESLARKLDLLRNTFLLMRDMDRGDTNSARDRLDAVSEREDSDT